MHFKLIHIFHGTVSMSWLMILLVPYLRAVVGKCFSNKMLGLASGPCFSFAVSL